MIDPATILGNPGLLKLELMTRGLRIPPEVAERGPVRAYGVTGHALFGSAGDLDVVLPGGTWAAVPLARGATAATPYALAVHGEGFGVTADGAPGVTTPVDVRHRSRFFEHTTSQGIPLGRLGTAHGPYLALSPTNRCTFLDGPDRCRFCGVGQGAATHAPVPVDDVVEAVRIARGEHRVDMVYLSVGHLGTADGGVRALEPYVAGLKKHFDVLVAVDALPPATDAWIDRTYAMGVDAVSYNLELWDPRRFEAVCPGPARAIGRQRFLDALGYAATVFPSGGTTCHLIVGLEPLEATREGIDALTALGVLPVLPLYRPFKGRDMRADGGVALAPPSTEDLIALHAHLYRAVRARRISLNLVRDIAIVTTPLDARFLGDPDGLLTALRHRIMGTGLGRRTSAYLSDLRRALRVRHVEEAPGPP